MSDQAIIAELLKRSQYKAQQYAALAYKAAANHQHDQANLYRQLADNAESDAAEYAALLDPYAHAAEYATA